MYGSNKATDCRGGRHWHRYFIHSHYVIRLKLDALLRRNLATVFAEKFVCYE